MAVTMESREPQKEVLAGAFTQKGGVGRHCHRCGGLMVGEFCMDLLSSTGELEFLAFRCLQCGDVVDPVILQNRRRQQEAMVAKAPRISVQSVADQVAA